MLITSKITIDMYRRGAMPHVDAVQGDSNTRAVEISLKSNGVPWSVPTEVTTIAIAFSKPDGTRGLYGSLPNHTSATVVSGAKVTAKLAPQVLTCPGDVNVSVVFYNAAGDTLATFPFIVSVAKNPSAGEAISNDFYYLQNLDQANDAYSELLARIKILEGNEPVAKWEGGTY